MGETLSLGVPLQDGQPKFFVSEPVPLGIVKASHSGKYTYRVRPRSWGFFDRFLGCGAAWFAQAI